MANRFFTQQILTVGPVRLEGDEAHHLATVRRFEPGDCVVLFNGDGHEYPATIEQAGKRSVDLVIRECREISREAFRHVTIASAFPKGDRFDFMLEKLVELGVARFVPLITTRSVVIPSESKRDKWQRAVIEASKQCGRNQLMEIAMPVRWESYAPSVECERVILHTDNQLSAFRIETSAPLAIAIGPEGGWTVEEIEIAKTHSWRATVLGSRILRTETAALAAAIWAINS